MFTLVILYTLYTLFTLVILYTLVYTLGVEPVQSDWIKSVFSDE